MRVLVMLWAEPPDWSGSGSSVGLRSVSHPSSAPLEFRCSLPIPFSRAEKKKKKLLLQCFLSAMMFHTTHFGMAGACHLLPPLCHCSHLLAEMWACLQNAYLVLVAQASPWRVQPRGASSICRMIESQNHLSWRGDHLVQLACSEQGHLHLAQIRCSEPHPA